MVGIRRLHSKFGLAPLRRLTRIHPRKTKPRHPLPGAERRLALAEDRAAARSCTDDLTFRSQRQRLSFLGRGVAPRPSSLESNYFQKLMEPGRPFRLAKFTACRKVAGMYRRRRPKSSRYGDKSATPQAFPPAARHCEEPRRPSNPVSLPLTRSAPWQTQTRRSSPTERRRGARNAGASALGRI